MRVKDTLWLGVLVLPQTRAWGIVGHEVVATIAQVFLTPNARNALCEILPATAKCHLAPFAGWADKVRNSYTAPLHFINGVKDWPSEHCSFGEHGWKDPKRNVVVGIYNSTWNIAYGDDVERDFALRYLIHFMGDLHMPLHLSGRDRGGNDDAVRFDHYITNLHSVWDGRLISNAIRTLTNYTRPLPSRRIESALRGTIYDSYVRFIVWEGILGWWKEDYLQWSSCPDSLVEDSAMIAPVDLSGVFLAPEAEQRRLLAGWSDETLTQAPFSSRSDLASSARPRRPVSDPYDLPVCPMHWAKPIHALNCNMNASDAHPKNLIWPPHLASLPEDTVPPRHIPAKELVQLDTPAYAGRIRGELVIEKLLATAGVRLAAVLNEILDPRDDNDVRRGVRVASQ